MSITVETHTQHRVVPGYWHRVDGWQEPREWDEPDVDFPFLARSGSVSAIGRTHEGAVSLVERILERRV